MGKYNEDTNYALLGSVAESMTAHFPDSGISVGPNANMMNRMNGASEKDIVQSGLQYTMERSAKQIISRVHAYDLGLDVRSAASSWPARKSTTLLTKLASLSKQSESYLLRRKKNKLYSQLPSRFNFSRHLSLLFLPAQTGFS